MDLQEEIADLLKVNHMYLCFPPSLTVLCLAVYSGLI